MRLNDKLFANVLGEAAVAAARRRAQVAVEEEVAADLAAFDRRCQGCWSQCHREWAPKTRPPSCPDASP